MSPPQRRTPASFAGWALTWLALAQVPAAGLMVNKPAQVHDAADIMLDMSTGQSWKADQPMPPQPNSQWSAVLGEPAPIQQHAAVPPTPYDKHGLDWRDGMCFTRERQSPINFDDHIKNPPSDMLKFHYEPLANVPLYMEARHGLISIDTSRLPIGAVSWNGAIYPLVRIDFHAQSEHLFRGKRHSMEIQFVHRRIDDPMLSLVIAVPIWSEHLPEPPAIPLDQYLNQHLGPYYPPKYTETDFNPTFQQFLTVRPPAREGEIVQVVIPFYKPLDLSYFLRNPAIEDSGTYIQYTGSLTTPPCSDTTTWFVRRDAMIVSDTQAQIFADSIFRLTNKNGNFRGVMPVNARALNVYRAQWVMQLENRVKRLPPGPNARTDKEFEAQKLASLAKELSEDAVEYMGDFGKRLRRSARALEDNYNKIPPITTPLPQSLVPDQWEQAVLKMQSSMQGIVQGVESAVDESMRKQTLRMHRKAAIEAEKARDMTQKWSMPQATTPHPAMAGATAMTTPMPR